MPPDGVDPSADAAEGLVDPGGQVRHAALEALGFACLRDEPGRAADHDEDGQHERYERRDREELRQLGHAMPRIPVKLFAP
jgi:hypothetical protein